MNETNLTRHIMLSISRTGARIFRQNVGMGWTGKHKRLEDGAILIPDPRPLHAGLAEGSSDLVGWTPVTITDDMVGSTVAVFTSLEVKTPKGRPSQAQTRWIEAVRSGGGIAGVVRGEDEARTLLSDWIDYQRGPGGTQE